MGGICCCARLDEYEEYYPSNSIYGQCLCLQNFFHQLFTGYTATFQRPQGRSLMTAMQGSTSLASSGIVGALPDNSVHDIHLANRLPSYDAEQRYSRSQRDGLVSRREKSLIHFQEESLPLRRNASSSGAEVLGYDKKRNSVESEGEGKVDLLDSEKLSMRKALGLAHLQPSSEDEDVCPTCLEEYTPENPKITTKCSHHFHLGCIFEWMERSESCPICGKEMEFCETAMGRFVCA